jgi:hypothetical protein
MFGSAGVPRLPALLPCRAELEGCGNDWKSTHLHVLWDKWIMVCITVVYMSYVYQLTWKGKKRKGRDKGITNKNGLLSACNNSLVWIHVNKSEANFVSMPNKLSQQQHFMLVPLYHLHRRWKREWKGKTQNTWVEPNIDCRDVTCKRVWRVPMCGGWLCLGLHWVKHWSKRRAS